MPFIPIIFIQISRSAGSGRFISAKNFYSLGLGLRNLISFRTKKAAAVATAFLVQKFIKIKNPSPRGQFTVEAILYGRQEIDRLASRSRVRESQESKNFHVGATLCGPKNIDRILHA